MHGVAALAILLVAPCVQALRLPVDVASRRSVITYAAAASATSVGLLPSWAEEPRPTSPPTSNEELEALDMWSRTAVGRTLPNGVRIIDVVEGTGPQPAKGTKVYCHFKVWANGFRAGVPADSSFQQARVYEWVLGEPTDRIPIGADEGVQGMREGAWRRMVIPAKLAYAEDGLLMKGVGGRKSNVYAVKPDTDVYFDVRMVDGGELIAHRAILLVPTRPHVTAMQTIHLSARVPLAGSGKCESLLHPPGVSDAVSLRLKSISCVRGAP